ncbi:MHS family proline/betaine transporter-like MFS transporter [Spinactinospora alkalitolerans]|uniref:Putative proline/betaine transporter n=1 Tax=Spinactinospora alkalitolerans TaxID=687207 RepID=A0A852TZH3_9ACTN|nr:MFS transporter [Spinactinospora alkalitolerans]NYE49211.1 MHS family proline/betaine transporter-like MFS transporter [Spinactinospora alkalitolerans]
MTSEVLENVDRKDLRRSVFAGSVGVFIHWFDWAIYAYLATTMAQVFFPEQDGTTGLLSVFAVFAVAFFVRPLGSVIFGHLGDRFGRKTTLSIVIISMAAGTLMLGLLPTYESAGIIAPVLLVVARIIQGLAAGGEFGSAAAFLAEFSPPKRRGFGCSWIEFGSVGGFLCASFVVWALHSVFTPGDVTDWAWRLPFLLTVPLAAVGLYIRLRIEDTPEYRALEDMNNVPSQPVVEVFRSNGKQFLQTVGIETFMNSAFYIVLVYLITYQEEIVGVPADRAALLSAAASVVAMGVIPLSGMVSDRVGRKPVLYAAAGLMIVGAVPLFLLMQVNSPWSAFAATFGLAVILAVILGTHASAVAELFPTRTRQSGLSMAYSVAGAFFAGTLPYLMTWLISLTGSSMVPGFTMIVIGIVGAVTLRTMPETSGSDLLHESDRAQR